MTHRSHRKVLFSVVLAGSVSAVLSGCSDTGTTPLPATAKPPVTKPAERIAAVAPDVNRDQPLHISTTEIMRPEPGVGRAEQALAALTTPAVTPEEWEAAHQRLIELGPVAVGVLAGALGCDDPLRRETAAAVLAGLGSDAAGAEEELLAALKDESPYVRANAATALSAIPGHEEQVIPLLAEFLAGDDEQLRQMAAANLGNFGVEAAPFVPQLADVLDARAADIVLPVVELLGRIGPAAEAAVPKLQQIAFEQEGETRTAVKSAIQRITAAADE